MYDDKTPDKARTFDQGNYHPESLPLIWTLTINMVSRTIMTNGKGVVQQCVN